MPAALACIEWIVHLAAYNYITRHGTASLSPCLPHPTSPLPVYSGSESAAVTPTSLCKCGQSLPPLPAKNCFAEKWLLSRRLFLSHLVLLFRPFDLIPASVVLFVLLLVSRILLLFWSLKPFLQLQSQSFCFPYPRPPPDCKQVIQLVTAVIHHTKGRLWQYSL